MFKNKTLRDQDQIKTKIMSGRDEFKTKTHGLISIFLGYTFNNN